MFARSNKQLLKRGATFVVAAAMMAGSVPAPAIAQMVDQASDDVVAYAEEDIVHAGVWGTCTWTIDTMGGLSIFPGTGASQEGKTASPWDKYASEVNEIRFVAQNGESVEVDGSVTYLFAQLYKVKTIDFSGAVFLGLTDTSYMFYECDALTSLDLSGLDTSSVVYMNDMFYNCLMLEDVNLAGWNTEQVVDMDNMFHGCGHLRKLDLSSFNTARVSDMNGMFNKCTYLESIDVSSFDTSAVTDMANMFRGCNSLADLNVAGFNTSNVTNMHAMFSGCVLLPSLELSNFDTSNVADMGYMFRGCDSLASLDLSSFDTSKATVMDGMFNGAGVESLDLSGFDVSGVEDLSYMFCKCTELKSLDVSGWDVAQVKRFNMMFADCDDLLDLDLSDWDTSGCKEATNMFAGSTALQHFTVGTTYVRTEIPDLFPDPTATNGMWWTKNDRAWLTKQNIVQERPTVSDTYSSVTGEDFQVSLVDADITIDSRGYAWTGEEIRPVPKVVLDGLTLREGIDYVLSYFDNIDVGLGTVTISGIGAYKGIAAESFQIVRSSKFIDVTDSTPHAGDIDWLDVNAISAGWYMGGGVYEFRPYAPIARADMAAFLFRLARGLGMVDDSWTPTITQSKAFVDVNYKTPHAREIRWLASVGISKGWAVKDSDKFEFRPYATVARQDMAAFLFRMAKLVGKGDASDEWVAPESAKSKFADVDPNNTTNHHNEVWWLAQNGVSTGWEMADGTFQFRGLANVARCDMAAFLHRMDQLDND